MNTITAEQRIKRHILLAVLTEEQLGTPDYLDFSTAEGIDAAYKLAKDYNGVFSEIEIIDEEEYFREGGRATSLSCKGYSRHYESEQVARKLSDGTYVSWVYWSGGGKHGEPSAMDWMDEAFEVNCEEKQEMVTTYTFTKIT
jgi:hypothetical protein